MHAMSGEIPTAASTQPRATQEFNDEQAVADLGHAYVRYRDGEFFCAVPLDPAPRVLYIGRDADCAVRIQQDVRVSRRHARLIFGAGLWSVEDGPSHNGTFVNGARTVGEQILVDRATITVGRTVLSFHMPGGTVVTTVTETPHERLLEPSSMQRKVLVELVRPFLDRTVDVHVAPTNAAIATKLGYSVTTIRDAISDLYHQAGLVRGTTDQRAELVRLALAEGVVGPSDLT
jgi:hypothetical protein